MKLMLLNLVSRGLNKACPALSLIHNYLRARNYIPKSILNIFKGIVHLFVIGCYSPLPNLKSIQKSVSFLIHQFSFMCLVFLPALSYHFLRVSDDDDQTKHTD